MNINGVPINEKDIARFWSKVNIEGDDDCWPWKSGLYWDGYGQFGIGKKKVRAHRVSYIINIGEIPESLFVLHKCDNPSCVNPKHLWIGTQLDNMQDMKNKGRSTYGDTANSKLSEEEVLCILKMASDTDMTDKQIADIYGVDRITINDILTGRRWEYLGVRKTFKGRRRKGEKHRGAKITDKEALDIYRLRENEDLTARIVAEMYGVSVDVIYSIWLARKWKHLGISRSAKRRYRRGEDVAKAKLNSDKVISIRKLFDSGQTRTAIAEGLGVHISTVGRVISGKTWKHI